MSYDDTPFLTAESAITDAVSYLSLLLLPVDHPDREDLSDSECLEQTTAFLDRAEAVLCESGVDQTEQGGEVVDGHWIHNLVPEINDQQAFDASRSIGALCLPLRQRLRTGVTMIVTKDFIASVHGVLKPFSVRLDGERDYIDRQVDMADAAGY